MKGLKKLALASAVLAVSTGAFAMEAMQDDALANTTGQDGLSILQSNLAVGIQAIRYTDSDGTGAGAATTALGIVDIPANTYYAGQPAAPYKSTVDAFASAGSLQISNLSITADSILTTIDVGSTGTGAGATTGLLIGSQITNLGISVGKISFDNGNELVAGANAGTTDIGGINIKNISLPNKSAMLITGGAADVYNNAAGTGYTSGLTITSLIPIASLSLELDYYNTNLTTVAGAGYTSANAAAGHANDGLITLPIQMTNVLTGVIEVAAGEQVQAGYNLGKTEGLEIFMKGTVIGAIDIGGQATGFGTGIGITGTTVGSVGILGLSVGSSQLNISGH